MANLRPSAGSTLGVLALGSVLLLTPSVLAAEITREIDAGITLLSASEIDTGPQREVLGGREALARIEVALEVLRTGSPNSYDAMTNLGGRIVIKYDPDDAFLDALGGPLAVFRSYTGIEKLDRSADPLYVAVLGARAVRWPAEDLAGIIVHEIVGHGRQHAEGRLRAMHRNDRECEARLYQLRACQDLGISPARGTMAAFQQSLEEVWCGQFLSHLRRAWPEAGNLWAAASEDPERVFASYEAYRRVADDWRADGPRPADTRDLSGADAAIEQDPDAVSLNGAQELIAYARRMLLNRS
ncbi:MAG: hypothetical protein ACYSVY_27675 [Planctomycetota bacterium]|jgi:hypothetical protein